MTLRLAHQIPTRKWIIMFLYQSKRHIPEPCGTTEILSKTLYFLLYSKWSHSMISDASFPLFVEEKIHSMTLSAVFSSFAPRIRWYKTYNVSCSLSSKRNWPLLVWAKHCSNEHSCSVSAYENVATGYSSFWDFFLVYAGNFCRKIRKDPNQKWIIGRYQ